MRIYDGIRFLSNKRFTRITQSNIMYKGGKTSISVCEDDARRSYSK